MLAILIACPIIQKIPRTKKTICIPKTKKKKMNAQFIPMSAAASSAARLVSVSTSPVSVFARLARLIPLHMLATPVNIAPSIARTQAKPEHRKGDTTTRNPTLIMIELSGALL
mmetsp:Transcript_10838/g.18969  ORF Transcript_10838/g.18969 Transcript_10838/m.18969 type:complete len:113 (-) Transcript_10838:704-1042(-)